MTADDISAEQTKAIALLLQGKTTVEVAEALGFHRTTIYKWTVNDIAFITAYNVAKSELLSKALNLLANGLTAASNRAIELLNSQNEPVALRAAQAVINGYSSLHQTVKVEERLTMLEQGLAKLSSDGK
jgi:Helix-turn-helix of insertion element transposase